MKEKVTPHLQRKIRDGSAAVALQFRLQNVPGGNIAPNDPLGEESLYSPIKGIVHKYQNRVLWKTTYRCAAHCQFCTRSRQIGSAEGDLDDADIAAGLCYIRSHPEIDDVILSGGDPLFVPQTVTRILSGLRDIPSIQVVRIGTRLPIHSPKSIGSPPVKRLLKALQACGESFQTYILVHVNHPDEIDYDVTDAIRTIRAYGFPVLSQTVFLKNVNDEEEVLEGLFKKLYYLGIVPYYIYRCDRVAGLERFVCDIGREREIMTALHKRMSGIALPSYIVDVEGTGKIPVPLDFWDVPDLGHCRDYNGIVIRL
ncbi:MAG: hypothetical protein CO088_02460 [Candidatus Yonathbacteria bacterium CG_4_9_14_0_8_um_filter_46_47]|uniref:Radical SAM core domain-containing protein n=1 Tax=Candidatus Yonathbacteria bacterium CG_4_9_14_0_8_um_filter_46_47 TaxID=1975106 RepID=A0A2M8D7A5_9BACT|nr:MAG: hypothetical protein COX54_01045 [Candidatus Yonathbacteria bacterium CG23_combo_of_CG06-09_8_20_14_all_46_18]PIQ32432.1 MAG: hypothetical protein COW61_01655 [Candidatus Yonathbacteria bacterium CG17_big_fil_post_rev_8_21_14_2_50_46_19]PIY57348.1 MAG: hypothetical protein COY99_03770 [Candidatus Yonathbacteria bacterium CG_4_10_14_0_8_um_filter_47_645]PJB83028.1 MAG: hypothetical protein CO088_02460 [Candidatus Yonathbacteria bacterium CG_4_9_14_0_8_um_filter_46_47]PJC21039.1 MAG: hypo